MTGYGENKRLRPGSISAVVAESQAGPGAAVLTDTFSLLDVIGKLLRVALVKQGDRPERWVDFIAELQSKDTILPTADYSKRLANMVTELKRTSVAGESQQNPETLLISIELPRSHL